MGFSGKAGEMCSINLGRHGGHFWRATAAASAPRYLLDCELIQFWRLAKKPGFSAGLELMNQPKFEFNRLNCPPTPSVLGGVMSNTTRSLARYTNTTRSGSSHPDRCLSPNIHLPPASARPFSRMPSPSSDSWSSFQLPSLYHKGLQGHRPQECQHSLHQELFWALERSGLWADQEPIIGGSA